VAEWIFIITGGMTFCYMLKLYISLCWEKHPTRQEEFDAMKKTYMKPLSRIALGGAAVVLPILGFFPDVFMTGMAELGQSFMHGHSPAHHVEYFSWVNLWGTFKSLIIGGALYVGVVRTVFKRKGDYVNLWPAWLDMENILFRSKFSYEMVPGVITKVSRFLDNLATSKFVTVYLAAVITAVTRVADEITDGAALLIRHSVLAHKKKRQPVPVGNRFTYALGRFLDGVAAVLNKTILRRRPIQTSFEYVFDAGRREMNRESKLIFRSMSFGLLLLCVGLYLTCWYLLQ
jgi:hydrogenase-4 component B